MAIQKPYNISIRGGMTIDADEPNYISWKVSGDISTRFSIYVEYNNYKYIKLPNHSLAKGDLILNTSRNSSIAGIRAVTVIDSNNISVNEILNQSARDKIEKYKPDKAVSSRASSSSTTSVIYVSNTGNVKAGDIVDSNGEYRFVSQVNKNVSITVSQPFSKSTANTTIAVFNNIGYQFAEEPFKIENVNSYATNYTLPPKSILNGNEYKIKITVFNENGESATSAYEIFQSSSRPKVAIKPITANAPSYNFSAVYTQGQGVPVRSWTAFLYDKNQVLLKTSGIQTQPNLEHIFENLQSEQKYYIEFQATSSVGLVGTSGKVPFDVLYTKPETMINLTAENIDEIAGVKLSWQTIQIIGKSNCSILSFVDNEKINLTNGCKVYFQEGFSLNKNFTLKIWFENLRRNVDLVIIKGINGKLTIQYWDDNKFHVFKEVNNIVSHFVSNVVTGNKLFCCVQQIEDDVNCIGEVII